ncbi:hypothetical protein [Anaeromassilibacillus senegalensis]|uniref:hypothetical protein n=1 Tax=Anaeromassilibacillus senegalensis TaxID=1673717 RepID=UPI0006829CF9|nr:hypothetical protein [Anaeromassilibacillus senegalensis]
MKKWWNKIRDSTEDVCILSGLCCIAAAALCVCIPLGLLAAGIELVGIGAWFTIHPIGGGDK